MGKKRLVILSVFLLVTVVSAAALAAEPIKLVVNGKEIQSDVPLQMTDNLLVAPVRHIAEALGCAVNWDEATRTVSILGPSQSVWERRVKLLEEALAPTTPETPMPPRWHQQKE